MNAHWIAERWLVSTLTADSQLMAQVQGVYVDKVPAGVTRYVLITNQDAVDVSYVNQRIGWSTLIYSVRVVGEVEGYGELAAAAERIHALLHRQRGETEAGKVLACYRRQPFRMIEREANREFRHSGGVYRLEVQGS